MLGDAVLLVGWEAVADGAGIGGVVGAEIVVEDEHAAVEVNLTVEPRGCLPNARPDQPSRRDQGSGGVVQRKGKGIEDAALFELVAPAEPVGETGARLGAEPAKG